MFSDPQAFPGRGCYAAIPSRTYHALGDLSSHRLRLFQRSPAHYRHHLSNPEPTTTAQAFGEMLHLAVLEPDVFARDIVVTDVSSRTNAYKSLVETHGPARVASTDEHGALVAMREAVFAHPAAAALFGDAGHRELTLLFEREVACSDTGECVGVDCKSRLDLLDVDACRIVDLKSARDASPRAFGRAAHDYGYLLQGAFYAMAAAALSGLPAETFEVVFVVVEKEPPYAVGVYRASPLQLAKAQAEIDVLTERYARCRRDDCWPAYSEAVEALDLPPWA